MIRANERFSACKRLLEILSLSLTIALSFVILASAQAQQQMATQSEVIKLDVAVVKAKKEEVTLGQAPLIKIMLRDANNQFVKAPKDFTVKIVVKPEEGEPIEEREVTIKQGEDTVEFKLSEVKRTGVFEIQAKQPEMLEGGTILFVKSKSVQYKFIPAPKPNRPVQTKPTTPKPLSTKARSKAGQDSTVGDWPQWGEARLIPARYSPRDESESNILLKKSPDRNFLADSVDKAVIWVVLKEGPYDKDIQINLRSTGGNLSPTTLTVPKGSYKASAELTSDRIGVVRISFVDSLPAIGLQGEDEIEVKFVAPVARLGFDAVPPHIPLVDKADLVVRLYDSKNQLVQTDEEREVSIDFSAPLGSLDSKLIKIRPGQSEGRTSFIPTSRGQVTFTAHAVGFLDLPPVTLEITIPILILILSMLGGLIGGLIAYKVDPNSRWWRIALGLVTGLMLYWACIFIFSSILPRGIVLNEFSAFALPVLGGWLGTEVFTLILRKFGWVS